MLHGAVLGQPDCFAASLAYTPPMDNLDPLRRIASKNLLRAPNFLASSRPIIPPSNTGTEFPIWRIASPQATFMTKLSGNVWIRIASHTVKYLTPLPHRAAGCAVLPPLRPVARRCGLHPRHFPHRAQAGRGSAWALSHQGVDSRLHECSGGRRYAFPPYMGLS